MTGDPLDRIEAVIPAAYSHLSVVALRVSDVVALVQVARAARRIPRPEYPSSGYLYLANENAANLWAALSRLGEEAE